MTSESHVPSPLTPTDELANLLFGNDESSSSASSKQERPQDQLEKFFSMFYNFGNHHFDHRLHRKFYDCFCSLLFYNQDETLPLYRKLVVIKPNYYAIHPDSSNQKVTKKTVFSRWTSIKLQDETQPMLFLFYGVTLKWMLTFVFLASHWRFTIDSISQIPPSIYQALQQSNASLTRIFPLLDVEKTEYRKQLYSEILDHVVCVPLVVQYEQMVSQENELVSEMKKRKRQDEENPYNSDGEDENNDDDDDFDFDKKTDLSVLEEQRVLSDGKISLLTKDTLFPKMKTRLITTTFSCEYSSYTLAAVLFTLALSNIMKNTKQEEALYLLPSFLRMRYCLSNSNAVPQLQDPYEKKCIQYLTAILSKNPSRYLNLEDQAFSLHIRALLEFFKNVFSLLQQQVGNDEYKMLSKRVGQFHLIYKVKDKATKDNIAKIVPREMLTFLESPFDCLQFDKSEVDPLSLNTSLLILKNRFVDFEMKANQLWALFYRRSNVYLCIQRDFLRDIQQVFVPYLCTCSTFLKRSGIYGMLYPIHIRNFYSDDNSAMLSSVKSLLRLFYAFRGRNNSHQTVLPRSNDPIVSFYRLLAPIMDRFSKEDIIRELDAPFEYATNLEFSKRKRNGVEKQVATGIKSDAITLYSALRAFCFVYNEHEIRREALKELVLFFDTHGNSMRNKWPPLYSLVHSLWLQASGSAYESHPYIPIPLGEDAANNPLHLLIYSFLALEEKLDRGIAQRVFMHIRLVFSRRGRDYGKIMFPCIQPLTTRNVALMLNQKYRDIFVVSSKEEKEEEKEEEEEEEQEGSAIEELDNSSNDSKEATHSIPHVIEKGYGLTILFEYLEQLSFYSTEKTFAEFAKAGADKKRQETLSTETITTTTTSRTFHRWLPLPYESVLRQREILAEKTPLYFDPPNQLGPVYSSDVLPIWKSEFYHPDFSGISLKKRKDNQKQATTTTTVSKPFTGAHKDFLNTIVLYPCTAIIDVG